MARRGEHRGPLIDHWDGEDLKELFVGSLKALTSSIDAKDPYTRGHSERVAFISRWIAEKFVEPDVPMISIATAHPAKFSQAITDALGEDLAHHPAIDGLEDLPSRCTTLPVSEEAIKEYIVKGCKQ